MGDRVALFIDYQNTYMAARDAFADTTDRYDYTFGQVDPVALGERILAKRPSERNSELVAVRIYRGMPDSSKDSKGYGACRAQVNRWRTLGAVPVTRPLRYPRGYPRDSEPGEKPQEKGIDVELAVDFVTMAVDGRYDVGVLMSLDTDLKPALEFVARRSPGGARVELAAWSSPDRHSRRLAISGMKLWCHWLDRSDFDACADPTDYVSI